ncbi:MAG: transcription termination/antitermination factor NusG [Planctomycetes bacterium]|nr:transcription termination/antitermination factor NusG [Planctomycetota bacterium]
MIQAMSIFSSPDGTDEIEEPVATGDSVPDEDLAERVDEENVDETAESSEPPSDELIEQQQVVEEEAGPAETAEEESASEEEQQETPSGSKAARVRKAATGGLAFEWYVIKVANGREDTLSRKVEKTLSLRGLDDYVRNIVVPKQKVTEIKDGKKRVREHKLYQGYFFMECQLVEEIWYLLRDIQGVGSFVGGGLGDKPMPMTPDEVRKLRDMIEQRESEAPPELKIDVKKNDTVKVKDGPFENFEGIVEEVHPKTGKLRVMVTIFGRETPVDLEYWQVEQT